jgi:hypothetical protein
MKKAVLLFLAFYPAVLAGQDFNFVIKNGQPFYSRVFDFPGQPQDSIIRYLEASLPLVPYVSNVRVDAVGLTATIAQMQISYSGFDVILSDPMYGNLVVQVKDEKYRIIVKDIYFLTHDEQHDDIDDFTSCVTKNGLISKRPAEEFREGIYTTLFRMDQYFTLIFATSNLTSKDDW